MGFSEKRKLFLAWTIVVSACLILGVSISKSEDRTIHFFGIYCDDYTGEGSAINEGVAIDKLLMDSLFQTNYSEASWKVKLNRTFVRGQDATKENVLKKVTELESVVGPEDTIYVHFSGHGAILDQKKGEQYLVDVSESPFSRVKLANMLEAFPCKLKILVTDCCSTYPETLFIAEGEEQVTPWKNVYSLLLAHDGFVNITAASPGQPAYGTEYGGYLTVNLQSDMQRYPTWKKVFQATQKRVESETKEIILSENGATPKSFTGGIKFIIDTSIAIRSGQDPLLLVQKPFAYELGTLNDEGIPSDVSFVIPDSGRRQLTIDELVQLDSHQLYLARNEIFARHGYDFGTPMLKNYFMSLDWYSPKRGFKDPAISDLERRNADLIKEVEESKGGAMVNNVVNPPHGDGNTVPGGKDVFPFSSTKALPRTAVQTLSSLELSIARNEIYARHGFTFSGKGLRDYFSKKPWYTSSGSNAEPTFNAVERHNIWLIRKIERIQGKKYKW